VLMGGRCGVRVRRAYSRSR